MALTLTIGLESLRSLVRSADVLLGVLTLATTSAAAQQPIIIIIIRSQMYWVYKYTYQLYQIQNKVTGTSKFPSRTQAEHHQLYKRLC